MTASETLTPDLRWRGNALFPYAKPPGDLSKLIATRLERPWLLRIDEPLATDAPAVARPHCCYLRTVIFYEDPYRVTDGGNYAEWDRAETLLRLDDLIEFEGETFKVLSGRVQRIDDRWTMRFNARREQER